MLLAGTTKARSSTFNFKLNAKVGNVGPKHDTEEPCLWINFYLLNKLNSYDTKKINLGVEMI